MEKESKRELLSRLLMIIGGVMTLTFGLLTAFIPGLAYAEIIDILEGPALGYYLVYSPLNLQSHFFTFGMLLSSVGGLLCLISSVKHHNKLSSIGFAGDFLGILGFLFYIPPSPGGVIDMRIYQVPWVGVCLTLISVSILLVGSTAKYRGWHLLTLLGIPLLLTSWLTYPFLIAINNLPLLVSIYRSAGTNTSLGTLLGVPGISLGIFQIPGYFLTFSGSLFGALKFHTDLKQVTRASD